MVTAKRRREAVFRAIADPTRRAILKLLRERSRTVGELAQNFEMSRPAVSKHVRVLRSAGLLVARKAGASQICRLNAEPLRAVDEWLRDYEALWDQNLRNLKQHVEGER